MEILKQIKKELHDEMLYLLDQGWQHKNIAKMYNVPVYLVKKINVKNKCYHTNLIIRNMKILQDYKSMMIKNPYNIRRRFHKHDNNRSLIIGCIANKYKVTPSTINLIVYASAKTKKISQG